MGFADGMNISASGLTLNRLRMDVISNNIANAQTTRTPGGGPYRRELVQVAPIPFQDMLSGTSSSPGGGLTGGGAEAVGIVQDNAPFQEVYDPSSPDAVNGYVQKPNVNISVELGDMVSAVKAYEANQTAFDASKQMNVEAINLGKA